MTLQSLIVLRMAKRAQMVESKLSFIDHERKVMVTIHDASAPFVEVDFSAFSTSLISTLRYLHEKGFVKLEGNESFCKVTHAGWHYWQISASLFLSFLGRSIITPILVSIATTLVTIWFSGLFIE